jgi:hypothetical protein
MPPLRVTKGTPLRRPILQKEERDRNRSRRQIRGGFARCLLHVLAMAVLLTLIAAPTLLPKFSVVDNDIWFHLKVADWIVDHASFPHSGILSRTAADRPWAAYSWIYEVLLRFFHSRFRLAGIAVYGLLLTLAVACSMFWMTRRLSGSFWKPCLLATLTCAAFLFRVFPRPVFFSMTLFTVTLTLLLEARRRGRPQLLYWLPPIFLLWANAHIQFIYGVCLLGLFVAVNAFQEWGGKAGFALESLLPPSLPSQILLLIFGACLLATCIGPYSYHLYSIAFAYGKSTFPYAYIEEFKALSFRGYADFVQLLLTGFAFFTLGRQKKLDLFLLALLSVASVVGFRTQRDSWFICIPAATCIALAWGGVAWGGLAKDGLERERSRIIGEVVGLAAALGLLIFLYAIVMGFNSQNLALAIADRYPVRAINFLRAHPQPGPLYNTFDWGGFISWYMPEYPVAIDGRTDLYGDEIDNRFFLTENGDPSWGDDPYLKESNVVLLPRQKPLAGLLSSDSRFILIYEDSLAMLFVRR